MVLKEFNQGKMTMFCDMLNSLSYNREDNYMFTLVNRIIKYITESGREYEQDEYMEDIDILWGTLVYSFGEYGTSPRYGWIENEYKSFIKIYLETWLNENKMEV